MFEQDYLMRLIMDFIAAMRRSMDRAAGQHDSIGAAQALDGAVGAASDIDSQTLLSLSSDSIASILSVSGTDPKLAGFMARGLLLSSRYYAEGGDTVTGDLRRSQAYALAEAFGHELTDEDVTPEALEQFFEEFGAEPQD